MDPLQRLPHGWSDIESNLTPLFQDPLYKFEPVEVGGQIFAYCKTPGIPGDLLFILQNLQGFVFDMDAVTLESGAPVTRILAACTPNIVQVVQIKPQRAIRGGSI